jgi:hypothetical protein
MPNHYLKASSPEREVIKLVVILTLSEVEGEKSPQLHSSAQSRTQSRPPSNRLQHAQSRLRIRHSNAGSLQSV